MKISKSASTWLSRASALCLVLVLQACGGGGGNTASSISGSNQVASGAVTGFGSVFVDGVEIEDATASVVKENYDGTFSNTVLQMGQRVHAMHNGKGTASKVTIDAAVIGLVSSLDKTAKTLTVAGQKVRVVSDSSTGTITVFGGGYSTITDVSDNDLIEVHGTPVYDSVSKTYTVNASRIAKVTEDTGRMQVAGTISSLNTTAKTFSLNGLTVNYADAALRPSSATLADGTVVTVYAKVTALSGNTLTASNLKVNRLQDSSLSVSAAQVGGIVSKYDSTAKTFEVQGVKVTIGTSTTVNPNGKTVANGAYVKVSGTVGNDGSFTATNIQVREQSTTSDLATVKLIGVISDFVDNTSFVVRGVPVDASGINASEKCPGVTLANGVEVMVTATQQTDTNVVSATNLVCKVQAAIIIRPVSGTVSSVDTTAKTFTLTVTSSTTSQVVQWNSNTTFVGVTEATLANSMVRVEGYLSGSHLVARSVVGSTSGVRRFDDWAFRRTGVTKDDAISAWNKYRMAKKR